MKTNLESLNLDLVFTTSVSHSVGIFKPLLLNSFNNISAQVFKGINSFPVITIWRLFAASGKNAAFKCFFFKWN